MRSKDVNLALVLEQVNLILTNDPIPDDFAPPSDFGIHATAIFDSRIAFRPGRLPGMASGRIHLEREK